MAATVMHRQASNGTANSSTTFEKAQTAEVNDGHLTVLGWDGSGFSKVLAVYAPAAWVAFTIDGEAVVN